MSTTARRLLVCLHSLPPIRHAENLSRHLTLIYVGVAWALTTGTGEAPRLRDIEVVQNWPGGIGQKVPSVLTYSANLGQRWGYGIGDNADVVIQWTKLSLEEPTRVSALKALKEMLSDAELLGFRSNSGGVPRHLLKTSEDILTDYLIQVAACVRQDIVSKRDPQSLSDFPIDLVITHPAVCASSYKCKSVWLY